MSNALTHAITRAVSVRRRQPGHLPLAWLSLAKTWMEPLEARKLLSVATFCPLAPDAINASTDPAIDLNVDESTDDVVVDDASGDTSIDTSNDNGEGDTGEGDLGPICYSLGGPGMDLGDDTGDDTGSALVVDDNAAASITLADVSADCPVLTVSVDADGNVSAVDGNGAAVNVSSADDGSIYLDDAGILLPAHLAVRSDGVVGLSSDYVPGSEIRYFSSGDGIDLGSESPYGTLPVESGDTTLTLADVSPEFPVLTLTIAADGTVTATDGNGATVDRVFADYDGVIYLDGVDPDYFLTTLPAHVAADANVAYVLVPGEATVLEEDPGVDLGDPGDGSTVDGSTGDEPTEGGIDLGEWDFPHDPGVIYYNMAGGEHAGNPAPSERGDAGNSEGDPTAVFAFGAAFHSGFEKFTHSSFGESFFSSSTSDQLLSKKKDDDNALPPIV